MSEVKGTYFRRERAPGRNFDAYDSAEYAMVYAEGVLDMGLGPNLVRFDLFRVREVQPRGGHNDEPLEIRERTNSIVLPTIAFVDFVGTALNALRESGSLLADLSQKQMQMINDLAKR